jgi:hydrogenase/urease accessory protein HupE
LRSPVSELLLAASFIGALHLGCDFHLKAVQQPFVEPRSGVQPTEYR